MSTDTPSITTDLLDEARELAAFCGTLSAVEWRRPSAFYGWSAWDEVAHLCFFDETALVSATDPARFVQEAQLLGERMAAGEELSVMARAVYGHLDGPALLALWRSRFEALAKALSPLDPKARLAWYGPPMSARSFATARLMETWAHGQDVWDVMGRRRPGSPRLKHIAHLGVGTFGWTFVNRGLPVPEPAPWVDLLAPDDSHWTWGDPASANRVVGTADDFCMVVTQRRHVSDTSLAVQGEGAAQWMATAQCFAGPPADGPAPGARKSPSA
jgi:uncharacterized protein (TIGR03084 family)